MEQELKRFVSRLSKLSSETTPATPYFVFNNYCVIGEKVFEKSSNNWEECDKESYEIYELAGLKLQKKEKRAKVDYLKAIEEAFMKFKDSDPIDNKNADITDDFNGMKKSIIDFYKHCFVGGGDKDLTSFYYLGILCQKFGEQECQGVIFKEFYNNIQKSKFRQKKSEIQKNLKGSARFKLFADKLPSGVYQLVNIHITYFVKITNECWSQFICGRNNVNTIPESSDEGK